MRRNRFNFKGMNLLYVVESVTPGGFKYNAYKTYNEFKSYPSDYFKNYRVNLTK